MFFFPFFCKLGWPSSLVFRIEIPINSASSHHTRKNNILRNQLAAITAAAVVDEDDDDEDDDFFFSTMSLMLRLTFSLRGGGTD